MRTVTSITVGNPGTWYFVGGAYKHPPGGGFSWEDGAYPHTTSLCWWTGAKQKEDWKNEGRGGWQKPNLKRRSSKGACAAAGDQSNAAVDGLLERVGVGRLAGRADGSWGGVLRTSSEEGRARALGSRRRGIRGGVRGKCDTQSREMRGGEVVRHKGLLAEPASRGSLRGNSVTTVEPAALDHLGGEGKRGVDRSGLS